MRQPGRRACAARSARSGHILRQDATSGLAADLKWLGGVLGAARDGEVLDAHLRSRLRQAPVELRIGPVKARIQGHFASVRAAARTELLAALDSERCTISRRRPTSTGFKAGNFRRLVTIEAARTSPLDASRQRRGAPAGN